jgi:hypothetical protein
MPQRLLVPTAAPIGSTLAATGKCGLFPNTIVIEITEGELIRDHARLSNLTNAYRPSGFIAGRSVIRTVVCRSALIDHHV